MLSDRSIGAEEVTRLVQDRNGTGIQNLNQQEKIMLASGLSVGEVLLRSIKPKNAAQLELSLIN